MNGCALNQVIRQTEPLVLSIDAEGNLYLSVGEDEDKPVEVSARTPSTPVTREQPAVKEISRDTPAPAPTDDPFAQ